MKKEFKLMPIESQYLHRQWGGLMIWNLDPGKKVDGADSNKLVVLEAGKYYTIYRRRDSILLAPTAGALFVHRLLGWGLDAGVKVVNRAFEEGYRRVDVTTDGDLRIWRKVLEQMDKVGIQVVNTRYNLMKSQNNNVLPAGQSGGIKQ